MEHAGHVSEMNTVHIVTCHALLLVLTLMINVCAKEKQGNVNMDVQMVPMVISVTTPAA